MQELHYSKGTISTCSPKPITPSQDKVAIVLHLFYPDLWQEIQSYLKELSIGYDLFVTVPYSVEDEEIIAVFKDQPSVHLYKTGNRGRDVLPFLQVMSLIGLQNYKYICKLHSKKTANSPLGSVWRKLLYFDLIGSNRVVENTIELFEKDETIGQVTGKNTILDSQRYNYGNTTKIDKLVDMSGFIFQDEYLFAGGTMFWTRADLLETVLKLYESGEIEFEEERGQKDNTIAHALERFFGIICHVKNKKIVPSNSDYSELDKATLDEVASLVLSQQYHGKDIFLEQNFKIEELHTYINTLKDLVEHFEKLSESLRLKSRVKKYIPSKMISLPKKALQVAKTAKNPAVWKKVIFYAKRGEIRYLLQKIREKSSNNLDKTEKLVEIKPTEYFKSFKQSDYDLGDITVDIIIPVYNGYEYLEALFDSLEKHTTSAHRLIVVNDASPDEKVKPYLEQRLKAHDTALFIDNQTNKGFVKSVNEAYGHANNHFVILNTDTELPAFWLERLMYPIINMENVASTTPFTNSGQIASFPNFVEDNSIFEGLTVEKLDRAFRSINPTNFYEEVPTGVGFCMGVNYNLAKTIGFFDEEAFGKGYGEENDWCQRAIKHNYRNLMVPNLFVYHKHGGSFSSADKLKLMQQNALKLLNRYPNYDRDVSEYVKADPHHNLRKMLVVTASSKKGGMHVIIDHALGGGANLYGKELIEKYREQNKKVLYITYDFYSNSYNLYFYYQTYNFEFAIENLDGVERLLEELTIAEIFVNSLVSFRDTQRLLTMIRTFQDIHHSRLVVPMHDYYPVCPNFTLLNEEVEFCEVPSLERCKACMKSNDLEWKTFGNENADVGVWRESWSELLKASTQIICFSNSSKNIVLKAYPNLDKEKLVVKPHTVAPLQKVAIEPKVSRDRVTIGVLGAINQAKGAGVLKSLVKTIEDRELNIDIVLIGEISEYIDSKHFKLTGRYQREELPSLVKEHNIDIFLIPSICPETFSYTTQEMMMMDMPLMVFNLGAPAERVKEYAKGVVLDKDYIDSTINHILNLK